MSQTEQERDAEPSAIEEPPSLPFKFLRNYNIRQKLAFGFGGLLVCLAATAGLSLYGMVDLLDGFQDAIEYDFRLSTLATEAEVATLKTRRHEKDFLLQWREMGYDAARAKHVANFDRAIEAAWKATSDIRVLLNSFPEDVQTRLNAQLDLAESHGRVYQKGFMELVELLGERGFKDSGLIGKFRSQAHSLEALFSESDTFTPLLIHLLELRRAEKDYLLRGDDLYVEKVNSMVEILKAEALKAGLPEAENALNAYLNEFSQLTAIDDHIDREKEEFRHEVDAVEASTAIFVNAGKAMGDRRINAAVTASSNRIWFVLAIIIVIFIGGLITSVRLAAHITIPIGVLSDTAKEVKKGRLDVETPVITGGEVGQLASTFNEMVGSIRLKTTIIEQKNRENEELLLNILPGPIATRLKSGEQVIADSFASVTVLFADIVGFTQMSGKLQASEVVSVLNAIFTDFDRIAKENGIEKIKTIGDAYMAVAGLPDPQPDHAERMMRMAKGMLESVQAISSTQGVDLNVRIGLNSGPVVAGVIGTSKFIYDLWGDTVNIASRMESHGVPATVQISDSVHELLKNNAEFDFELRGEIDVKGKGLMRTWLLKS